MKLGVKSLPVEDIFSSAEEKGIGKDQAEEMIEKLKRSGDLFEPKRGFIQRL